MAINRARQIAPWQHVNVLLGRQFTGEGFIVEGCFWPEIEPGIGKFNVHDFTENRDHCFKLGSIGAAVLPDVSFISPGRHAGKLVVDGHGAAVVGAVLQEARQDICVPSYKAGSKARQVAALGQAVEHDTPREIMPAHGGTGLQQAFRWIVFVGIKL